MRWSKVPWPLRTAVEALKRWNLGVGPLRLVHELIGMIFCEFAPWFFYDNFMIGFWWSGDGISDILKSGFPKKKSSNPTIDFPAKNVTFEEGQKWCMYWSSHGFQPRRGKNKHGTCPDARCLQELTRIVPRTAALNGLRDGDALGMGCRVGVEPSLKLPYCWWFRDPPGTPIKVGSWNPMIYRGFTHPNGGWEWDFWISSRFAPKSQFFGRWNWPSF